MPPAEGSQLVVPRHDLLFAGHLGISLTVFRLQTRLYWPGLRNDIRTYIVSCTVYIARKSPCPRRAPMGHVVVVRLWERVAMGNRYVLVMMDCFSRWTEACPLSNKTAISVAGAFFSNIVCRFGMPSVIHSDQGQEFGWILACHIDIRTPHMTSPCPRRAHKRRKQPPITRRVTDWLSALIEHY